MLFFTVFDTVFSDIGNNGSKYRFLYNDALRYLSEFCSRNHRPEYS